MEKDAAYIKVLEKKLEDIKDLETLKLIRRLIIEREELIDAANTDILTGINNRRILNNIDTCNAVVMCDIDDFKIINDVYGHDVGDIVIKSIANIIRESVHEEDYVCRFGGDEFFIGFVNSSKKRINNDLRRIMNSINSKEIIPNIKISLSFGIAYNIDKENLDDLIKTADKALYKSKKNGKNQITQFEETEESIISKK